MPDPDRIFDKVERQQAERRARLLSSLICLGIGTVLCAFGAGYQWGVGAGIGILGVAMFILGVLIGKD